MEGFSLPHQARERNLHYRRHPTDAQDEASGDAKYAAAAGDDQVPVGARAGHQGQYPMHRQGEVHAHAQDLPQHAPPGGLHLRWRLRRPLHQPSPLCQPRPLRRILLLQRLRDLWRPRPLRRPSPLRQPRPLRGFRPLWQVLFLPWLLLCAGVLNGITLEKAKKKIKESFLRAL